MKCYNDWNTIPAEHAAAALAAAADAAKATKVAAKAEWGGESEAGDEARENEMLGETVGGVRL